MDTGSNCHAGPVPRFLLQNKIIALKAICGQMSTAKGPNRIHPRFGIQSYSHISTNAQVDRP